MVLKKAVSKRWCADSRSPMHLDRENCLNLIKWVKLAECRQMDKEINL